MTSIDIKINDFYQNYATTVKAMAILAWHLQPAVGWRW